MGQGLSVFRDKTGAIIGEPFPWLWQDVDEAKAVLHGDDDEVLHILALDALSGSDMGDCLPVAAVEGERAAGFLLVVATDLEAI